MTLRTSLYREPLAGAPLSRSRRMDCALSRRGGVQTAAGDSALATQLNAIAFGSMLRSCREDETGVWPVYCCIVDVSAFAADKLADRGSVQAAALSTVVRVFCVNCRRALEDDR